jgi:hypothetical protein
MSNNQVQLPLTDGIGLQSTQANEALLSCLSASFGGSPPAKHRCYPCHQILLIGIKTKQKRSCIEIQNSDALKFQASIQYSPIVQKETGKIF